MKQIARIRSGHVLIGEGEAPAELRRAARQEPRPPPMRTLPHTGGVRTAATGTILVVLRATCTVHGVPLSYRVEKMRLNKDKTALTVNPSLTLAGIPPEVFSYRLGNRSALDWVIDRYQVSEDKRSGIRSDPNRGR